MLGDALRYPFRDSETRDATAFSAAVVLATFVLLRFASGLWPAWVAVIPALLAAIPGFLFVGHLAAILRETAGDGSGGSNDHSRDAVTPFEFTWARVRLGVRTLLVAVAYLLVPGLIVAVGGYLLASGSIPAGAAGLVASIIATVALLVVVAFTFLLPGAIAVGIQEGVRAAFRRSAFRGLAGASYFVAWTGAAVLTVLAWGAVSLTTGGTIGGFLALLWFTYAHLVAVRLIGTGLANVHGR